jgi:DNA modification methylase
MSNTKIVFTYPGTFIKGDCLTIINEITPRVDLLFLDPPYDNLELASNVALKCDNDAMVCFMYPENINSYFCYPEIDRVCHWIKPVSTKNTKKNYSQFVEAICVGHGSYFNQNLHWSTRTGIFTDTLIEKQIHPHQKPFSLVEKLVLLHTPPGGTVLDPFCGSQVVKHVCDKHGFKSLSIDIKDWRIT